MAEELKDEDLKLTPQADGSEIVGEVAPPATDTENDERLASPSDGDTDPEEQGHANETEEEAEERRQRNRERRAQNKNRRKEHIDSLRREIEARDEIIAQAMQRLEAVEKRSQGADFAALDNEIKKTTDAYNYFKQQIDLGTREQNGSVVADATEKMMLAKQRYDQLNRAKQMATKQSQTAAAAAPLDPRLKAHAGTWLENNKWYDVEGKDEDSYIVKQIDNRLAQEGWNPTTEAYWTELDSRVKKYLPHRVNSGHNKTTQTTPRSPVAGSGRDGNGAKGSGYVISAERIQALKDAGIYDDPKARADAVRRFQEYDKQHSA